MVCKCLDYDQSCIRYGHFTPRSQITLKIVWSRPWKLSPNKRQLHNINSNKYQSSGATTAPRQNYLILPRATPWLLPSTSKWQMANYFSTQSIITLWKRKILSQGCSCSFGKAEFKMWYIWSFVYHRKSLSFAKFNVCPLCVPTKVLKTRVFNGHNWPWRW